MSLTGTESVEVRGQNPSGIPASSTFLTTTQAIAALALQNIDLEEQIGINIKTYGDYPAIGDGTYHALSEYFPTLAAAQAVYSVANDLGQGIDGVVIEQMIHDEQHFYLPPGTYVMTGTLVQSGKTFRMSGVKGESIIQGQSTIMRDKMLTLNSCNITISGVTFEGTNKYCTGLRSDTGYFYGKDIAFNDFGDPVDDYIAATSGCTFDDPFEVVIDGITGSNLQSRKAGQITTNDGLCRLIQIGNGTASTSAGWAYIKNLHFDATGSQAPQLDVFVIVIDGLRHVVLDSPVIRYNEYTRRAIKVQGNYCDVVAPDIRKTATFSPDAAGNTDVGSYCLNCVDATATTGIEGSLVIHGGYIDASGMITGIARSTGTATVKALGCIVQGSTERARKLINIESASKTADTSNISGNILTLTSHGFPTATPVSVEAISPGVLPTGIPAGALYYVRAVTADSLTFHPTAADASANTNIISISGGSGTFTIYTGLDTDQVGFYTDTQSGYGSSAQNCTFINFTMGYYLRAQYSFVKDCVFYDPIEYLGYIGTTSNSVGHEVSGNTCVTVTSGALNNTRICRIFDVTGTKVFNNRLLQAGNTGHATRFFDATDADSSGSYSGNVAPVGTTPFNISAGKFINFSNVKAAANTTATSNVGAGEDNLQTITIPASPFNNVGDWITIKGEGRTANNANAKTLKFYWGNATVFTLSLATSVAGQWSFEVRVMKTATDAQDISYIYYSTDGAGVVQTTVNRTTATESEASSVTIKCTGEATTNGDITQESMCWN